MTAVHAPTQIQRAALLLWASLGLITVQAAVSQILTPQEPGDWIAWVGLVSTTGVEAWLIYLIPRRKNWARVATATLGGLGLVACVVAYIFFPEISWDEPWWSDGLFVSSYLLEIAAIVFLFSRASNEWFRGGNEGRVAF